MKRLGGRTMIIGSLSILIIVSYIIWDNKRIEVTEAAIPLEDLPPELEGFSILHISDLHEKEFGKNQKRILKQINSLQFDALVMTGDMLNSPQSTNTTPFYTLLEGIDNKENAYFVRGNDDPLSYEVADKLVKSEFIQGVEERGVTFLESKDTIQIDGAIIRFINFELSILASPEHIGEINGTAQPDYVTTDEYAAYQTERWKELEMDMFSNDDVVIALNHYPIVDKRIDYIQEDPSTVWRDVDLIMAGHYHGGQIRLPFLGALFVPEPWYEPTSFFPPQNRVKGLWEYNDAKQYVSAGLGSSGAIPFLNFRLFNTPEINLLKLTGK